MCAKGQCSWDKIRPLLCGTSERLLVARASLELYINKIVDRVLLHILGGVNPKWLLSPGRLGRKIIHFHIYGKSGGNWCGWDRVVCVLPSFRRSSVLIAEFNMPGSPWGTCSVGRHQPVFKRSVSRSVRIRRYARGTSAMPILSSAASL